MAKNDELVLDISARLDSSGVEEDAEKLFKRIQKAEVKYLKQIGKSDKAIVEKEINGQYYGYIAKLNKAHTQIDKRYKPKQLVRGSKADIVSLSSAGSESEYYNRVRRKSINLEDKLQKQANNMQKKANDLQNKKNKEEEDRLNKEKYLAAAQSFSNAIYPTLSKADKRKVDIEGLKANSKALKEQYINAQMSGQPTEDIEKSYLENQKKLEKLQKIDAKSMAKSGISKLFGTIKRVGFYRIARMLFSFIEQGFKAGIQNLAQFDDKANQTMGQLKSSFTTIFNSVTSAVMPLLEAFVPIIQEVATVAAQIANEISRTVASMKGLTTYTKINAEYMEDYNQSANSSLLSFDKFNTLSNNSDDMYTTASVNEESSDITGTVQSVVGLFDTMLEAGGKIWEIVKKIFELVQPILDILIPILELALEIISEIFDILSPIISVIVDILKPALDYIAMILNFFVKIIKGDIKGAIEGLFSDIEGFGKNILNMFIGIAKFFVKAAETAINFIIDGLNTLLNPLIWILNLIGVKWDGISHISFNADSIKYYEKGGIVDSGSLFYAGENNKTELVYSNGSNGSYVANVQQLEQAVENGAIQAIYKCSDVFESGDVILDVDGAEIARSKRFISEINRKNSSLNLI